VKGRTFVIGDIHGAHKALLQCLSRAGFDRDVDHLIALGDVADGWPDTKKCIDELLTIKNLTFVLGNHDYWTLEWMASGLIESVWYMQGGKATVESYRDGIPSSHILFLKNAVPFHKRGDKVFVHAGLNPDVPLEHQTLQTLLWDRSLSKLAIQNLELQRNIKLTKFEAVYIGHTPIGGGKPLKAGDVWLMDTAAGWSGVLSMMDIHSEEVFSSDRVPDLYPGINGRSKKS
jgi:serine/threonine protein phosphatase 1